VTRTERSPDATDLEMWREFEDKVVVVTGSGGGIGATTAELFARRGARVVVNDLTEPAVEAQVAAIRGEGGEATGVVADVSDADDVTRIVASANLAYGPVDVLVNNAAHQPRGPFLDHTIETWDRTYAVNMRGTVLLMQAVLPSMIERGAGSIVNLASIAGLHTTTPHTAYAASKAAIISLTRDVAVEVGPSGVRVNAVAPGPTDSRGYGMTPERLGVPYVRAGMTIDIAEAVAFLASERAAYIVGETLVVSGGANLKVGGY
jgi:NAD(P)-dependent dehydrogenase (short-subunit alcohol dehydrogenase family)